MKKLKLKALQLGAKEVLTRAQLKNVLGGSSSGSGTAVSCRSGCAVTNSTTVNGQIVITTTYGSCILTTVMSGGQPLNYCNCSAIGTISQACASPS
ncbi:MAG: hypothetical protein JWP94_534 [Mucilaginibacter sp.]|nr:hypothetical protein [Mucilaginibacter sp.]